MSETDDPQPTRIEVPPPTELDKIAARIERSTHTSDCQCPLCWCAICGEDAPELDHECPPRTTPGPFGWIAR